MYHSLKEETGDIIVYGLLSTVFQVHPLIAIALFLTTCYSSSTAFQLIRSDLNLLRNLPVTDNHLISVLLTLKNYHILVCETTDLINYCFGWVLAVIIPFHFVSVITASFYLFGHVGSHLSILAHVFFCMHVFHLFVVCCIADFVRNQVT